MNPDPQELSDASRAIKSCCSAIRNAGITDAAIFHAIMAESIALAVRLAGVHHGFQMIDHILIRTRELING